MTHILTAHGRQHYFASAGFAKANAPANVPSIREGCHSLAQINRFTGHCKRPYSVAEHSILVRNIAISLGYNLQIQLLCLMHDFHECITGDVASPIKIELGMAWTAFEHREQHRMLKAYRLDVWWDQAHDVVKQCDLIALATERRDLLPWEPVHHEPWPVIDTPGARVLPWNGVDLYGDIADAGDWQSWKLDLQDAIHDTAVKLRHNVPGLVLGFEAVAHGGDVPANANLLFGAERG
jgi:uncharacterized protein